ncbi:MAG: helix-turn-helix transcriptional regulator [Oscillospiraceae bacterium]|nr:helix-turn-helix transcriptional regulator [Oscillospiraceae bacterium]
MKFPRIKTLRKEKSLTQGDMAKQLKISQSSYGR